MYKGQGRFGGVYDIGRGQERRESGAEKGILRDWTMEEKGAGKGF